jgi:hypothetical protein
LKAKQRLIRDTFETPLTLRVHRALSWMGRAEREVDDSDVKFILLWIAFNAAYAGTIDDAPLGERESFRRFFECLLELDSEHRIYSAVWDRFSNEIRLLLRNKYVFAPFWARQNNVPGNADWGQRLEASHRAVASAMAARDTGRIVSVVFDRLYVLRNQLIHGGATWQSSVNRDQVRDGAAVLGWLVPVFIDIMMDHPERGWDMPHYPVVD